MQFMLVSSLFLRRINTQRIILRSYTMSTSVSSIESSGESVVLPNVAEKLSSLIHQHCAPVEYLDIINESYMHSVPKNAQTHFKILVVSPVFQGLLPIARHRLIFALAKDEMRSNNQQTSCDKTTNIRQQISQDLYYTKIHALSIIAKTPDEWLREIDSLLQKKSPVCLGGGSH